MRSLTTSLPFPTRCALSARKAKPRGFSPGSPPLPKFAHNCPLLEINTLTHSSSLRAPFAPPCLRDSPRPRPPLRQFPKISGIFRFQTKFCRLQTPIPIPSLPPRNPPLSHRRPPRPIEPQGITMMRVEFNSSTSSLRAAPPDDQTPAKIAQHSKPSPASQSFFPAGPADET
jgi:hypothetical protein